MPTRRGEREAEQDFVVRGSTEGDVRLGWTPEGRLRTKPLAEPAPAAPEPYVDPEQDVSVGAANRRLLAELAGVAGDVNVAILGVAGVAFVVVATLLSVLLTS